MRRTSVLILMVFWCAAQSPAAVDFAADIQPIFKQHCHQCHGISKQRGDLRLDARSAALRGGDHGPVIAPGQSGKSKLIEMVTQEDERKRMPREGKPLSADQIEKLKQWIDSGAAWPDALAGDERRKESDHWAFKAPVTPALPAVKNKSWPRNPIDNFVLARLEEQGITPSKEADRYTLARRVALDLTGLPPSIEEADAFVKDASADAYEKYVDRLLASPHYGERWARRWLDLARYGDTNGFEKDRERSMWPWRDWVIRSLNADMPFNQFTLEQIAGDMLPGATADQRIASGFHRNTMTNEEGGIDVEEYRFHSLVDRVNTTGSVWLGLTLGCTQCHTHKYDPISHREYYSLMAFYNQSDEPEVKLPDPAIAAARAKNQEQITQLRQQAIAQFAEPYQQWQQQARSRLNKWELSKVASAQAGGGAFLTPMPDGSLYVEGDNPNRNLYTVELSSELPTITAIRLEAIPDDRLPGEGSGRSPFFPAGGYMVTDFRVSIGGVEVKIAGALASYEPAGKKDRKIELAIDSDPDTGWTNEGAVDRTHQAVFIFEKPVALPKGQKITVAIDCHYLHQVTLGRFRLSATSDSAPAVSGLGDELERALGFPAAQRAAESEAGLQQAFLDQHEAAKKQRIEIEKLRKSMPAFNKTLVMQERDPAHRRVTNVHHRGEFLALRDAVEPATLAVLHPIPSGQNPDRMALAKWLVDPANPLVGRVTMNRQWEAIFGRGIVRTTEDFGTQGEPPTHPQLLDWLATEFIRRGWSLKQMHRLMVTSATYRQASALDRAELKNDPQNLLLGRGPRARVEAEMVRDLALAASGLLSRKIGGPSVFPPQPEGVTELSYGGFDWNTSQGEDRYRRGLYTFMKRTSPYAAFTTFDAPSGEACMVRRERSNTPLQALTLLNDAVFVEASSAMARRATASAAEAPQRITMMFRWTLTRPPAGDEFKTLTAFYDRQLARLKSGELKAKEVVGAEDAELAALAMTGRAILNLDETITKE